MDYTPWPENGCSLAEALERTADRRVWNAWRGRRDQAAKTDLSVLEEQFGLNCLDALKSGQLVGYASHGHRNEPRRLIDPDEWTALNKIDWTSSRAAEDWHNEPIFFDVRLFPPLLAPCRIDLLAGQTLRRVFHDFVLNDIEVRVLASEAIAAAPEWKRVFVEGRCSVYGHEGWPLAINPWLRTPHYVHPDPVKQSKYDPPRPDPIEAVFAAEALSHRFRALLAMLRSQEICGEGVISTGSRLDILFSIWSHQEYYLEADTGDILQENPRSEDRQDYYTKCYRAVVLNRPRNEIGIEVGISPARPVVSHNDLQQKLSHVKPTECAQLPSGTKEPKSPAKKAADSAKAREAVALQCKGWLEGQMRQSPKVRAKSKTVLWAEAKRRWPELSERSFERVRSEAISQTGATVWAEAGAPPRDRT